MHSPFESTALSGGGLESDTDGTILSRISRSRTMRAQRPVVWWLDWRLHAAVGAAVLLIAFIVFWFRGNAPAANGAGKNAPDAPPSGVPVPSGPRVNHALAFDGHFSYVTVPTLRFKEDRPWTLELRCRKLLPLGISAVATLRNGTHWLGQYTEAGRSLGGFGGPTHGMTQYAYRTVPETHPAEEWIHVAVTWDGMNVGTFVNGEVPEGSFGEPIDARWGAEMRPWVIGQPEFVLGAAPTAQPGRFLNHFIGELDEIRLSSVNRYRGPFKVPEAIHPDEYTVALYHCDEGTGTVLKDSTANGHDGVISGATWVPAGP